MSTLATPRFLRAVLWFDAVSCAASAALHLFGAGLLAHLLGLPAGLLVASGLVLCACAAGAAWIATREPLPRAPIVALSLANWAWVAGCLGLLFTGAAGTTLGQVYLVLQAVAVAVLAELQWFGARRPTAAALA